MPDRPSYRPLDNQSFVVYPTAGYDTNCVTAILKCGGKLTSEPSLAEDGFVMISCAGIDEVTMRKIMDEQSQY